MVIDKNILQSSEKLNIKKKKWKLKLIICFVLILIIFEWITILLRPSIILLCKYKSENLATSISSSIVQKVMSGLGYLDLITLDRDEKGNILALRANVIEMNKISSEITTMIQNEYHALGDMYIKIPIGNFIGNELLAGRGPKIVIKILPVGSVITDYKTEFISSGINQTRHRVYLEIKSEMTVVAPLINQSVEVVNNINIAETVLIGNVPNTFYNLEGITTEDTMNMMGE